MAGIAEYLANISTAKYGRDVRSSIYNAIKECYSDVSKAKTTADESVATMAQTVESAKTEVNETRDNAINQIEKKVTQEKQVIDDAVTGANGAAARANEAADNANNAASQAVRYDVAQVLTDADKERAQANIGLDNINQLVTGTVKYDEEQQLTDAQMIQARLNLGMDLHLEYDESESLLRLIDADGNEWGEGVKIVSGGGGGGQSVSPAECSMSNTVGWTARTIAKDTPLTLSFNWTSVENGMDTGNGSLKITNNNAVKALIDIPQGDNTISIDTEWLTLGMNKIVLTATDAYGTSKSLMFRVTVVALSLSSSLVTTSPFYDVIQFPYTPVSGGDISKTVHFIVDGTEIGTYVTSKSGTQQVYTIPKQTHGAHIIKCYFEAEINAQMVRSNELTFSVICLDEGNTSPVISSTYEKDKVDQYSTIVIEYMIYNPSSLQSNVVIKANGATVSEGTVDRKPQVLNYRADNAGPLSLTITSGTATKTFDITVEETNIDAVATTENLALYLTANGRNNNETTRGEWKYNDISATMSNFGYVSDGWMMDSDGYTMLRVSGNARVEIPYKVFETDFRNTGKTIEIEFATSQVLNYDSVIISCMSGGRGIEVTPQLVTFKSSQASLSAQYVENEHLRISFVIEKRSENRLIFCYIDGIPSGVVQYPDNDDFSQMEPVNITIGSNGCTTDIYCIRVYDNNLTRYQILDNFIADAQTIDDMLSRYGRNDVYDDYGHVIIAKIPSDLPYFILDAAELPQYKGDKKTITGEYVDPVHSSKSFTFEGCQINVQGTSSAPYARKNYDMQFKKGFDLDSGHSDTYLLDDSVLPFNRFVLKADVASSEGANNVELVKLYCDMSPYKTREMLANPKVRQGIFGIPIVVFWHNLNDDSVSFLGKYNFNFPKRAPGPYGYSGDMESWEFQNNTSDLMNFKTDYFDESMLTDPDTGETKEAWRFDYEARMPSDEWVDYSKLQEFQSFVYSTYREKATGASLPTPVVYTDTVSGKEVETTYTSDTAEYRLAKFKHEFGNYAEIDSFVFYYLFTELFLMIDSRAKNLFIGFSGSDTDPNICQHMDRKAVAEPYDMDTAIGINNEGKLAFSYNLEDTDHVAGGANVFNGQESVLWNNVRDAFGTEIRAMYRTLRSAGLSYPMVEKRFEDHQAVYPEALWIEDAMFKYIYPLTNPDPGKESTAMYLKMLLGSKEKQRKWWLYNRFRYMDSKWNAGDALGQPIQLRAYQKGDITVTPYADIYPSITYGSFFVQERGAHGVPTTLTCPMPTFNDTEIYIYSAPQIASVGDLSPLKVGFADFSKATRLNYIKLGDASSDYENRNMNELDLGSNALLKTLDVRNCTGLGLEGVSGDGAVLDAQKAIDLSGCSNIEEAYFDGTNIGSVALPNGGVLRVLHLPATITALSILNQTHIEDFVLPDYTKITTLRLENVNSVVDGRAIFNAIPANSRVRMIGFDWDVGTYEAAKTLYNRIDTMRGLDEFDNNMDKAQMMGTIRIPTITGAQLLELQTRYPDITVVYEHVTSKLYYYNYNGSTLLYTDDINDGGNGTYTGTPERAADDQFRYTFVGWSTEKDAVAADPNATKNVLADRTVYAAYSRVGIATLKYYNYDGSSLIHTEQIENGGNGAYTGTPSRSADAQYTYTFVGWSTSKNATTADANATKAVTANRDIYAAYSTTVQTYTVTFALASEDGGTTLQTVNNVPYGGSAEYTGSTPTSSRGDGYTFSSWNPAPSNINENTTCYAIFENQKKTGFRAFVDRSITEYNGDTLEIVGNSAFNSCSKLTTVSLPAASSISSGAFKSCTSLTDISLPAASSIGDGAFNSCSKLTTVSLPAASSIGRNVFSNCASLIDIYLPNAESTYSDAPWGATNATIHYEYDF